MNCCFRPEETAEFLDEDGFAHMGDLGYYDEEGKLYFT
jgi:long-subunit acyl-CoA synthetase (AMP-forming)